MDRATPRSCGRDRRQVRRRDALRRVAEGEAAPVVELDQPLPDRRTARIDWSKKAPARRTPRASRSGSQPTDLMPTDGIVQGDRGRDHAGQGDGSSRRRRRVYDWILANTYREPKVRGCGVGDIKAMLETKNFGGKCADLNGLFVGLRPRRRRARARRLRHPRRAVGVRLQGARRGERQREQGAALPRRGVPEGLRLGGDGSGRRRQGGARGDERVAASSTTRSSRRCGRSCSADGRATGSPTTRPRRRAAGRDPGRQARLPDVSAGRDGRRPARQPRPGQRSSTRSPRARSRPERPDPGARPARGRARRARRRLAAALVCRLRSPARPLGGLRRRRAEPRFLPWKDGDDARRWRCADLGRPSARAGRATAARSCSSTSGRRGASRAATRCPRCSGSASGWPASRSRSSP